MSEFIDLQLLSRHFDGTVSEEERAAVLSWVGDDPERRAAVAELAAAWATNARRLEAPYDADTAWAAVAPQLRPRRSSREVRFSVAGRAASRRRTWSIIGALAATLLFAVAIGHPWQRLMGHRPSHLSVAPEGGMREYRTARAQRATVRLADGTDVMLNADSRLRVPEDYGTQGSMRRELYLDGEGYFRVVHDTAKPFLVHTGRGVTRDVGTRFDIRAYAGDATDHVVVTEGTVEVRGGTGTARVLLTQGMAAVLPSHGEVDVLRGADIAREIAWTRGRIDLQAVPLAEAARRLARWYDLDIAVTDTTIARRLVTGSYGSEPMSQVLTVMTAAVGARYEWHGRTVTISSKTR